MGGTCRNVHDKASKPGIMITGEYAIPIQAMNGANITGASANPSEPPEMCADMAVPLRCGSARRYTSAAAGG